MGSETIPRPQQGDVVDLILDDHRLFEALLRDLRDPTADKEAARQQLADLLVAHGEAEEQHVYTGLVRKDAIDDDEAEHGEHEHAEINEALLALLECAGTDTQKFDDAVEDLATALNHHVNEEEQTILAPARTDVDEQVRHDLGATFLRARGELLDGDPVDADRVRGLVERAEKKGLLDDSAGSGDSADEDD
ncbi:hemerythrin domain-containing protein [Angustibacter speluncae]